MVKITLSLILLVLTLSANSLEKSIEHIVGKESFIRNKGLISVLFKDEAKFKSRGRVDLLQVTKILKDNDLLSLKLPSTSKIKLNFATEQNQALMFIKLIKDSLTSLGYNLPLTTKAIRDKNGFLWQLTITSSQVIDPYLLTQELQKRDAQVTDIIRYSADNYRYDIATYDVNLKTITIEPNQETNLKKPLHPYWIDLQGAKSITLKSRAGNNWHPYIIFYDRELKIITNYTKERKSYNVTLKIPPNAKYIKISDLYALINLKRGLVVEIKK